MVENTSDYEFDFEAFEQEIYTWAEGTSQEARSAFASQCAARVLPHIGGSTRPKRHTGFSFDLTLLRAILTSAVAGTIPTAALSADSARSAARSARSALSADSAARSTALSAALSARSAARSAAKTLDLSSPKSLFEEPLWLDVKSPDDIANNWKTLRTEWSTDPAMAFWIDWYDGLLIGRTPDWDLWQDIVLIDDKHWKAGTEAVAREIDILQAAYDLDGKIAQFEAQLLQLASEPVFQGNRDNGGPPIEDHQVRLATIQLIQAQLDILKAEVAKTKPASEEQPDPEVIKSTVEKIVEYVKKYFIVGTIGLIGTTFVVKTAEVGFARYHVHETFFETFEAISRGAQTLLDKLGARVAPKPKFIKPSSHMDSTPIDT